MKIIDTTIPDVKIIEPTIFGDDRGFFFELFQQKRFNEQVDASSHFVQDNLSRSQQGVLRGLHYQCEQAQGKLVSVLRGCVFDVAVDIRPGSATFGRWVGVELSAENHRQLWIPAGFAHGFYVLSDIADFYYKCTNYYNPLYERSLMWNDPTLAIEWPLLQDEPRLSDKDKKGLYLKDIKTTDLPVRG